MKQRFSLVISILAVISLICSMVIMLFIEPEVTESVFGGLLIGCIIGSALGVFSLIINKGKNKMITTFSIIPMLPLVLYLLLLIPYLISK